VGIERADARLDHGGRHGNLNVAFAQFEYQSHFAESSTQSPLFTVFFQLPIWIFTRRLATAGA
jgi:hypothetical protein